MSCSTIAYFFLLICFFSSSPVNLFVHLLIWKLLNQGQILRSDACGLPVSISISRRLRWVPGSVFWLKIRFFTVSISASDRDVRGLLLPCFLFVLPVSSIFFNNFLNSASLQFFSGNSFSNFFIAYFFLSLFNASSKPSVPP